MVCRREKLGMRAVGSERGGGVCPWWDRDRGARGIECEERGWRGWHGWHYVKVTYEFHRG